MQLSTPTKPINEILQQGFNWEAAQEKYGAVATADARAVLDAVNAFPWYGSDYQANRSRFEWECRNIFSWLSDEAIANLHMSYASGWIP